LIPTEFWSIQEDIANASIPYFKASDIQDWLVYRHYPIMNCTKGNSSWKVTQRFNVSSYGKWRIPINLIMKGYLHGKIHFWLTPQYPYYVINYIKKDDWLIINNQQAGKYLSVNLLSIGLEPKFVGFFQLKIVYRILYIYIIFVKNE